MSPEGGPLKRTPLYETQQAAGARMVPFGGWEMALQYRSIGEEHRAVRSAAGLFDVSHMGQVAVRGAQALAYLQHLLPADLSRLAPGGMLYSPMCAESGGVVDDLLVYHLGKEDYLLVVNAARTEDDWAWLQKLALPFEALHLQRLEAGMLAVQGPRAEEVVAAVLGEQVRPLTYYTCAALCWRTRELWVSRSGYTGEDGYEIICPPAALPMLWEELVSCRAQPCGLGARDTLRTEMGYCLYGRELDLETTPLEARLGWTLALDKKTEFVGGEALRRQRRQGGYRRLVGLRLLEKGIPRPGCEILDGWQRVVGRVSSGIFSPTLRQGIALGFVEAQYRRAASALYIDLRGRAHPAVVVRPPFVPARVKKAKTPKRGGSN